MPINDDLTTIYEIPDEIKGNFTKEFIEDFRKSAIEIFRQNDINLGREPYDYESYSYYDWWVYVEGSSGFYEAFQKVCKKYNLEFIVDYYDNLPGMIPIYLMTNLGICLLNTDWWKKEK